MTTAALPRTTATPFGRISRVVKLNLANPMTTVGMPALILGAIFVLNLAIWVIIRANSDPADQAEISGGLQFSGATTWIFFYMLVVAVQAINLTFPLALGYGSTRRDFYLGSVLTFVILSAMWSILLGVMSLLEEATGGWWLGGRMFTAIYFGGESAGIGERVIIFFCAMLFFFLVGAATATVYVRWKVLGMVTFFSLLALALVGAIAGITMARLWPAVGQFFVDAQALGVALWLLVPTALAGLAGYLILRRATPRS